MYRSLFRSVASGEGDFIVAGYCVEDLRAKISALVTAQATADVQGRVLSGLTRKPTPGQILYGTVRICVEVHGCSRQAPCRRTDRICMETHVRCYPARSWKGLCAGPFTRPVISRALWLVLNPSPLSSSASYNIFHLLPHYP